MREIAVFSGSAHPELAAELCRNLGVPLLPVRIQRFANDCLEVQLQANCRERDVFLIQPLVAAGAGEPGRAAADGGRGPRRVGRAGSPWSCRTTPTPARTRRTRRGSPSAAGWSPTCWSPPGASRVLTMTLHSPQVHGFFSVPVDHLHALRELAEHFRGRDLSNTVVVAPDLGYAKRRPRSPGGWACRWRPAPSSASATTR